MVAEIRERNILRELQDLVDAETEAARRRFPTPMEHETLELQVSVLMEEVGKLSRAGNKLGLSADDQVSDQWRRKEGGEAVRRAVTSISILQRYVLSLHDWPALPAELRWRPEVDS